MHIAHLPPNGLNHTMALSDLREVGVFLTHNDRSCGSRMGPLIPTTIPKTVKIGEARIQRKREADTLASELE